MENEKKLSFNKRISLVKKEVFEQVSETKELSNIKGSRDTGFYSLATIEKYLFPSLDKYNLDLDLEIFPDKIIGHWYDCIGDNHRAIIIDFKRIENVGKLQMMVHEVQSEGAVKSYTRRYGLTAILRLPSTDLIDTDATNNVSSKTKSTTKSSTISDSQIKRLYAIIKNKNYDDFKIIPKIKKAFTIKSMHDFNITDYNNFCSYLEQSKSEDNLIGMLDIKIKNDGGIKK